MIKLARENNPPYCFASLRDGVRDILKSRRPAGKFSTKRCKDLAGLFAMQTRFVDGRSLIGNLHYHSLKKCESFEMIRKKEQKKTHTVVLLLLALLITSNVQDVKKFNEALIS